MRLERLILAARPDDVVDFLDGDARNCCRFNLVIRPASEPEPAA